MKQIILIDDNRQNQRAKYGAGFVDNEEYSDCLVHKEKLNSASDFSFLDNAICIMIHDSLPDFVGDNFKSDSHKVKDIILDFIQENAMQCIVFSDGQYSTDLEETNLKMKKSEFYFYLRDFLESYMETGSVNLKIAAYGKNYMKHDMLKWYKNIMSGIKNNDNNTITLSDIDKVSLRQFLENSQPKVGITYNQLMSNVDDGLVTVRDFKDNINRIIDGVQKYGKNISVWK